MSRQHEYSTLDNLSWRHVAGLLLLGIGGVAFAAFAPVAWKPFAWRIIAVGILLSGIVSVVIHWRAGQVRRVIPWFLLMILLLILSWR